MTIGKLGWASLGFARERRGRELGWLSAQERERGIFLTYTLFYFYFFVFQNLCTVLNSLGGSKPVYQL
jgi:hypothetical protein